MATLEKIRSKSVLLLVIIGAALIAFIIGDFFTSGRTLFGTGDTVAKVGSQKISISEFQRQMEQANQQAQASGQKIDQAMLQQQVLNGMIAEKLFNEEIEKLGLTVTDEELSQAMLGSGSAALSAMIAQQTGIESAATFHDMAFNPTKYGLPEENAAQLRDYWVMLEQQTEQQLLQTKFNNLFAGTLVANQLDAKALYDESAATQHVAYVRKPFTSLADDDAKFEVTDADIKAEWEKHKASYRLPEEMRTINYITVDIAPSEADIKASEKEVEDVLMALNANADLQGIDGKNDFVADRRRVTTASLTDARIRQFADSAAAGKAALVSRMGNDFTLAKLFSRSVEVDSVNIDMIMVGGGKASVDSVLTALRSGTKIDSLARFASVQGAQDSVWVSMLDPQIGNYKNAIAEAATGVYFTPDTAAAQGGMIFRVNNRKAAVPVADIAIISYTAEPSAATVNTLQAKLQEFINANPTAEAFAANANKAGFQTYPARVSASTPGITNLADTRNVVSWAMKAGKGKVSPIFGDEQSGRFVAAALNEIYKDYLPATDSQVKQALTAQVRNDKKAAYLIEQYKGKATDLAGYAKLMDVKVDSATVNFGQITLFNPGFAGAKPAAIASVTPKGKLTAPIQGNNGVVVMQVVDVDTEGRPYNFQESSILFTRMRGAQALSQRFNELLLGNRSVKNNLLKFFQD